MTSHTPGTKPDLESKLVAGSASGNGINSEKLTADVPSWSDPPTVGNDRRNDQSTSLAPHNSESTPLVELHVERVSEAFTTLIPRDFARDHLIVSQGHHEDAELLAITEDTDPAAVFNTGVRLGMKVETSIADPESIARVIDDAYSQLERATTTFIQSDDEIEDLDANIDRLLAQSDQDLLSTQGKGPVIKLVDAILFKALQQGASDVHIQPMAGQTLIRYRLDGVLHTVRTISATGSLPEAITSRIKVMGRMDIAEKRLPQDGRASVTIGNRSIDLRISTLPTSHGERSVIRLLDNDNHLCDFNQLGMSPEVSEKYLDRARRTNGIILLTGPTGSGKTTTLYVTLRHIGSPGLNIMTIEDPIEYELSSAGLAISQSQINPRKGVTFASGLRHLLRQDPDIVMVGEIRDAETARIAIQSSLTGHLVFSTLHTNDAPSTVTRLIDLGVEAYLVAASLSAVMAQRLVRTIHISCSGKGCPECFRSGFRGRTGLFELMVIDEAIRDFVTHGADLSTIREAAKQGGMRQLAEEGERLVQQGCTTALEMQRMVQGVDA